MRFTRIVSLLVAVLAAAIMSSAFVAPAQAQLPSAKHDLRAAGTEVGNSNHFVLYGTLTTYHKVFIFRKVGSNPYFLYRKVKVLRNVSGGRFKVYKKVKTRSTGKFRTRIYQVGNKKTCFRVQVPRTAAYKKTTTPNLGCITTS